MNYSRRTLLIWGALLPCVATFGISSAALATSTFNQEAYKKKSIKEALTILSDGDIVSSDQIHIKAAEIAENGAVVPISITSSIEGTEQIAILVEKNPNVLAADFNIPTGTQAFVSTRLKMAETSNVYAAVRAGGKWHTAKKEIKITIGGCGG